MHTMLVLLKRMRRREEVNEPSEARELRAQILGG